MPAEKEVVVVVVVVSVACSPCISPRNLKQLRRVPGAANPPHWDLVSGIHPCGAACSAPEVRSVFQDEVDLLCSPWYLKQKFAFFKCHTGPKTDCRLSQPLPLRQRLAVSPAKKPVCVRVLVVSHNRLICVLCPDFIGCARYLNIGAGFGV